MSDLLIESGIELIEGFDPAQLNNNADIFVIGNTLSRGNPCVEEILNKRLPFCSGPEWLSKNLLRDKHVIAVSGTHGKTTTTSMIAWILESAGRNPGFLIGGVAENFGLSARLGDSDYFVIEADEYDTGFFDKRSKFIHYHPNTLVINNIEFDHADIFNSIDEIKRQFHHLLKVLPASGQLIIRNGDRCIKEVLEMGCWTDTSTFAVTDADWSLLEAKPDYSAFHVCRNSSSVADVQWELIGQHNAENALAAIAAAHDIGIEPADSCRALADFKSVKRRLEKLACIDGVTVYDDFAHHPTAIKTTIEALKANIGNNRVITVLEPRSNTMKMGFHKDTLAGSLSLSDRILLYQSPEVNWELDSITQALPDKAFVFNDIESIINSIIEYTAQGDHVVIMSNGGFENIHKRLISRMNRD
jgi:UDP-N-acetylmuramate: L-alanyl-gamma-D-glutamyl-meso-diaminopimelate ligase